MNKKKMSIFSITLSGIMIALSVIIKLFTPYFPIAGAMVLRLDFYGAFEKLPAVLFGPMIGGIVGALVDFLGYVFANKTATGYLFLLTITAFLNCFLFAALWMQLRAIKNTTLKTIYGVISIMTLVSGILAFIGINGTEDEMLYNLMNQLGEKGSYLAIGLIIAGGIALIILIIDLFIEKSKERTYLTEYFFKLFVALILPGILVTILNTFILRLYIPFLRESALMIFMFPRVGAQIIETLFDTYLLGSIISIAHPYLKKKKLL